MFPIPIHRLAAQIILYFSEANILKTVVPISFRIGQDLTVCNFRVALCG
jgi:hypothetical protein